MIEQATAAKTDTCPRCGAGTVSFRIKVGFLIHLDDHDLPMTVDPARPDVRHRLWQHLGPRLGWAPQFAPVRSWEPLRTQHECGGHENKKENKQ